MKTNNDLILESVKKWLEQIVIGLNFCPFARKEFIKNSIRYVIFDNADIIELLKDFQCEIETLKKNDEISTTLIIIPNGFDEFEDYLDLVEVFNFYLDEKDLVTHFQLATFHPEYCFEGNFPGDITNFTNKSPYAIIHILREKMLTSVIENYGNTHEIPQNNINLINDKGATFIKQLFESIMEL